MQPFPTEILIPRHGILNGEAGNLSIDIPLAPLRLPNNNGEGSEEETALRMQTVDLPSASLVDLAGTVHAFPLNPSPGYVDASIYIQHGHHPVDILSIRFGNLVDGYLEAEFETLLVFEYEGLEEYGNTPWTCRALLHRG